MFSVKTNLLLIEIIFKWPILMLFIDFQKILILGNENFLVERREIIKSKVMLTVESNLSKSSLHKFSNMVSTSSTFFYVGHRKELYLIHKTCYYIILGIWLNSKLLQILCRYFFRFFQILFSWFVRQEIVPSCNTYMLGP